MTIEKGRDWGSRGELPDEAPIVSSDRELAELFTITRDGAMVSLAGPDYVGVCPNDIVTNLPGTPTTDLARTVSARAAPSELRDGERTQLPVDLTVVTVDGTDHVMASSLVIRRPFWLGAVDAAMNASFLGDWNVTPSGHPNDGRLDVIRAELSASDRWKARSRLASGTHVPHPDIAIRRLKTHEFQPDSRATVRIDGVEIGHAHEVGFIVVADAVTIVI